MIKKMCTVMMCGMLLVATQQVAAHAKHGQYDSDDGGYLKSGDGSYVLDGFGECVAYTKMPKAGPLGCKSVAKPAAKKPAAKPAVVDTDRDGIADTDDQCPATPARAYVDITGCEFDDDNDGIVNSQDACADTAEGAKVDAKGCYVTLKEAKRVDINVKFTSGSSVVPVGFYDEVSRVAAFMKRYPITNVTIEGHTDSQGAASFNKSLSQKRANAIASLLVEKFGIDSSRVSAIGYGEAKPIASNATREGRATNRRVVASIATVVEKIAK